MGKSKIIFVALFIFNVYQVMNAQFAPENKNMTLNNEYSGSECYCNFNSDFDNFMNTYALYQHMANQWLAERENAFKEEIEDRLGKNFSSFEEAQKEFFKQYPPVVGSATWPLKEYRSNLEQSLENDKWEASRTFSLYRAFELRRGDLLREMDGLNAQYDFGDLVHYGSGERIMDMGYVDVASRISTHEGYFNEYESMISSNQDNLKSLNNDIIPGKKLESYIADQYINHYNSNGNYLERVQLMQSYLISDYLYESPFYMPTDYPERFRPYNQSYYVNVLEDMDNPYSSDYTPNMSINEIKTNFAIFSHWDNPSAQYAQSFVENHKDFRAALKNYWVSNDFSEKSLSFASDLLRRYETGGFPQSDDRIDGVYESPDVAYQTEDRSEFVLTTKISQKGIDFGIRGISYLLSDLSEISTREDWEGRYLYMLLSKNGVPNVYRNFTYEELARLFDFTSTSSTYIKIRIDNNINESLFDYDGNYGKSLFENPEKRKLFKLTLVLTDENIETLINFKRNGNLSTQEYLSMLDFLIENWNQIKVDYDYSLSKFLIYYCVCDCLGAETDYSSNLEINEEPKWGQLANKNEVLNEIRSISGLDQMPYVDQVAALANHFNKNLMYDRNSGQLIIVNPSDDVNRYIYTEKGGWIDLHHTFLIFQWAVENGPFNALGKGELGELWQSLKDNASAYSYEDLPSNLFGVGLYQRFSEQLYNGTITWEAAISQALDEINWIEPESAPNFNYIPHIVGNGLYPKNFTYQPLLGEELKESHRTKFCERSYEEQLNIIEAHEKFHR